MGTYLVMKNNFKRSFHHKPLFIMTFLLPIVACILFGLVKFDKVNLRIGILEPEGGLESLTGDAAFGKMELYEMLNQSEGIKYGTAAEESLNTDLIMGKFQVILDYRSSSTINQFKILTIQPKEKETLVETVLRGAIVNNKPLNLGELKKEGLSVTERSAAVLLTLFFVIATLHSTAVIRDKQNGTFTRYQYAIKSGGAICWDMRCIPFWLP